MFRRRKQQGGGLTLSIRRGLWMVNQTRYHQQRSEHIGWIMSQGQAVLPSVGNVSAPSSSTPTPFLSLQDMCLAVLAKYLNEYLVAMGVEELHVHLSMLPPGSLSMLSVLVSRHVGMTDEMTTLFRHTGLERLSLVAPTVDDDDDGNNACWNALTDNGLLSVLPSENDRHRLTDKAASHTSPSMSSWQDTSVAGLAGVDHNGNDVNNKTSGVSSEENDDGDESSASWDSWDDDDLDEFHSTSAALWCAMPLVRWKRLELGNLQLVTLRTVRTLLEKASTTLTHLSFAGSLDSGTGPEVLLNLLEWVPHLTVLDLSFCASWLNEALLRCFLQQNPTVIVLACNSLSATAEVALEMAFPERFFVVPAAAALITPCSV